MSRIAHFLLYNMEMELGMIPEIDQQRENLARLCRRYRVRQLQAFGSAVTGAFVPASSDLDFIAEFADTQSADYADRYLDFAEALEKLFNRRVDVLTKRSIRNKYFRAEVERTARVIYEDAHQKAAA
jgi:uncharacterized protein